VSLRTLHKIKEAIAGRPAELAAARASGAKVAGWFGYNLPEEVLHALGFIPVRIGTGGSEQLVELGSRHISTKNCVFTRQLVGLFEEKKDPYVNSLDLLTVDTTCLQLFRTGEVVEHYFKLKTVFLGVPRNFTTSEGREYFFHELESFVAELEEIAGHKLEPERLRKSIELYNGIRHTLQALYQRQARDHASITWLEVYNVVHAGYYLDREQYLALLQELLDEVKADDTLRQAEAALPDTRPRVILSGSVIPPGDNKLIGIIESLGGRIVGDDLWSGLAPYDDVNIHEPSIRGISDAYLDRVPHSALIYLDQKTDRRLAHLRKIIKDFRGAGVVYHSLRYCDAYTFKTIETKNVLKDYSIPLLDIHTEYAGSDIEAIRTRAEAFLEMLKAAQEAELIEELVT
jgi:benzoyl-CoA reductase/2-hydroxyglutaryl-CoA dehydratase subunit BcrC/BadD/HgdB